MSCNIIINKDLHSKNQDKRIKFIIMHYTETTLEHAIDLLTNGEVSAHYLIPESTNEIYQLVAENNRAWHAGNSFWQNRTHINDTSIGIEIVNQGYSKNKDNKYSWQKFTEQQIINIIELAKDIIKRYQIPQTNILAHSDIAPERKLDPGPLFPWEKLAHNGIGAWYNNDLKMELEQAFNQKKIFADIKWLQKSLLLYGYNIKVTEQLDPQTKKVISAFQMHFRSKDFSGFPDLETFAILAALNKKYYPAQAIQLITEEEQYNKIST